MTEGRVLGVDHGERRIGLAVSDPRRLIAHPLEVIDVSREDAVTAIGRIASELGVDLVVVGLPVHLAGNEGASARAARQFGDELARATGLTVDYWNEQFSSVVAERSLLEEGMRRSRRKVVIDKVAAAVMLQAFLDARR